MVYRFDDFNKRFSTCVFKVKTPYLKFVKKTKEIMAHSNEQNLEKQYKPDNNSGKRNASTGKAKFLNSEYTSFPLNGLFFSNLQQVHGKTIVALSKDEFFKNKSKLLQKAITFLKYGKDICFVIDGIARFTDSEERSIEYAYSREDMLEICRINIKLREAGMKENIRFSEFFRVENETEYEQSWSLEKVVQANAEIDTIVDFIKSQNFSPFEAMLYIHRYVSTGFSYSDKGDQGKGERSSEDTRNIVYAYEFGEICCAGYSSLVKAIIDKLGNPNLKCVSKGVQFFKTNPEFAFDDSHAINFIQIVDEKYGINGQFREDACWDSKYDEGSFANFLQPIDEYDCYKEGVVRETKLRNRLTSIRLDMAGINLDEKYWKDNYGTQQTIPFGSTIQAFGVVLSAEEPQLKDEKKSELTLQIIKNTLLSSKGVFSSEANDSVLDYIKSEEGKRFIIHAIEVDYSFLDSVCDVLKNDRDFAAKLTKLYSLDDREKLLDLVSEKGEAFIQFSNLRNDREFMYEAIYWNFAAIQYSDLKNDRNFMLNAIQISTSVICFTDLVDDKEFMIKAIELNQYLLEDERWIIFSVLKNDKEFVSNVMRTSPEFLKDDWLKESQLQNDKEFMIEAISLNQSLLENLEWLRFSDLRMNKEFILHLIELNPLIVERDDWDDFALCLIESKDYLQDIFNFFEQGQRDAGDCNGDTRCCECE